VEAPWPVDSPKSTGAAEMSTSTIEAVGRAWATISEEAELPPEKHGTATPLSYKKKPPHHTNTPISYFRLSL
ncbi:hypothetical protein ACVGWG_04360, partial [Enterobacter asburiae]